MKKSLILFAMLIGIAPLRSALAETNALLEVKLFKNWIIKSEWGFGNLAIKNTGTDPIFLTKDATSFALSQLHTRSFPAKRAEYGEFEIENNYQMLFLEEAEFFNLLPEETHVYEGRKFLLPARAPFSEEMRFIVSIYLGKGFWLDSEPLVVNGVVPDSEEYVATVGNVNFPCHLVTITYKNERWLYLKTLPNERLRSAGSSYYSICPVSLTSKIRVEPHDGKRLYKIWDGDKSMIYQDGTGMLFESPDENDVLGKWTRERKQQAEADNAEVRRKKQEAQ